MQENSAISVAFAGITRYNERYYEVSCRQKIHVTGEDLSDGNDENILDRCVRRL